MNYQEWERTVPAAITGDSLWKMEAYRLSLFAGDLAWEDATKLMRDRRTYSYALGSGREGRDWYYKGRHVLGESVTNHRLDMMTQIIRILLVMIPNQRGESLREGEAVYGDFTASELAT